MAKRKGVSGKTHTKQQLNDYANQNNPNNKACRARRTNEEKARKTRNHFDQDMIYYEPDLGFGWCDDQDLRKAGICMGNFFYNLFNGKTGYTISDSMAVDEDGDLLRGYLIIRLWIWIQGKLVFYHRQEICLMRKMTGNVNLI